MAIPSRQIGWGTEENLLWQISKQLEYLTGVTYKSLSELAPTYKVYTALLTQSGGSNGVNQTSGTFTVGVTYKIDAYNAGDDFSNIGGPAAGLQGQWDGFSFVATGTTALVYSNSSSIDHNEGAPVVTVLENTIGNIWFEYNDFGKYLINSSNLFSLSKTMIITSQFYNSNGVANISFMNDVIENTDSLLPIRTWDGTTNDDLLYNTPIEIRVYN
jgi:hypothetical protein